jgi:hypothetical protein
VVARALSVLHRYHQTIRPDTFPMYVIEPDVVACEPATLGGDEGHMGLSEPVLAAVDGAVELVAKLVDKILKKENTSENEVRGI